VEDPAPSYQRQSYPAEPYPRQPYPGQDGDRQVPRDGQGAAQPTPRSGGAEGNERLTAMTGAVLLILLAVEGFTILRIGRLLTWHFFIGMLLLGPVALKAGSTMYRFTRYYTGHPEYKRKGPPAPLLRVLGPCIVLLTAGVFGSGIMLALVGPAGEGQWLFIHRATFILWICAMTIHVLTYVWRLPRLLAAEARGVSLEPHGETGGVGGYGPAGGYGQADRAGGYGGAGGASGYAQANGYGGAAGASGYAQAGGRHAARRAAQILGGRGTRLALLAASLLAGLVIALLTVHLVGAWQNPGQFVPGPGKVFIHP
jgi:hypothetical protein